MRLLEAPNLSAAWLTAVRVLAAAPAHQLTDVIVAIADPRTEVPAIRAVADALTKRWPVETSANTIFPRYFALQGQTPEQLAARYERIEQKLRHTPANRLGTYFGQLVAYRPTKTAAPINQLAIAVHNANTKPRLNHVYDMTIAVPGYNPRPRGFPCLAYLNFKISGGELLLTAHYRNHFFIDRAYGNYLGLSRLQSYLAGQMHLRPGAMVCVSGHAFIGGGTGSAAEFGRLAAGLP